MKKKSLIGALAAAATLLAGLAGVSAASALPTGGTNGITVTATQTTLDPGTWKAYELVKYTAADPATGTGALTSVTPDKVSDDVQTTLSTALSNAGDSEHTNPALAERDLLALAWHDSNLLPNIASNLAQNTGNLGTATSAVAISPLPAGATSAIGFNVPEAGLYLLVDSSTTDKSKPMIVSSSVHGATKLGDQTLGTAVAKTSSELNPKESYTTADGKTGMVAVGDLAKFKITQLIPDKNTYAKFVLRDRSVGYNIDFDSIRISFNGGAPQKFADMTKGDKTTLEQVPATGSPVTGFTLSDQRFETMPVPAAGSTPAVPGSGEIADSIIARHSGETMTITYDATPTAAPSASNPEIGTNTVSMVTTDNEGKEDHHNGTTTRNGSGWLPSDVTLTKIDAGDQAKVLSGAHFNLYKTENGGNHYVARLTKDGAAVGWAVDSAASTPSEPLTNGTVPARAASIADAATYDLVTGTDGKLDLSKLTVGDYVLHETKAPADHSDAFMEDITIHVNDHNVVSFEYSGLNSGLVHDAVNGTEGTQGQWTETIDNATGEVTSHQETAPVAGDPASIKLANISNIFTQLPATGGTGAIAGVILLALLLLIGWASIENARRISKKNHQVNA